MRYRTISRRGADAVERKVQARVSVSPSTSRAGVTWNASTSMSAVDSAPSIASACALPCLTSVRRAWRMIHRVCGSSIPHCAARASTHAGLALVMSFRWLATDRRTYRLGSARRLSRIGAARAGDASRAPSRNDHGRRGRVPSLARRRTASLGCRDQAVMISSARGRSSRRNSRTANSDVPNGVKNFNASMERSKAWRPCWPT